MKPINQDTYTEALLLHVLAESTIEVNKKITTKTNFQRSRTQTFGCLNPHLKSLAQLTDPKLTKSMLHTVNHQITLNLNSDTIPLKPNTQIFVVNRILNTQGTQYINHITHIEGTVEDGTLRAWPIESIKSITLRLI